jgi:hypothetical protein
MRCRDPWRFASEAKILEQKAAVPGGFIPQACFAAPC